MDTYESQGFQIAYPDSGRSHLACITDSFLKAVVPGFLEYR